jgi:hypothetical protein
MSSGPGAGISSDRKRIARGWRSPRVERDAKIPDPQMRRFTKEARTEHSTCSGKRLFAETLLELRSIGIEGERFYLVRSALCWQLPTVE